MSPEEIGNFQARFVSLHALAKRLKRSPAHVRSLLEVAGIAPAFDPESINARFYPRTDDGQ